MKNNSQKANQLNANLGLKGVNKTYAKVQGNRGKQLNSTPNNANTPKPQGKTR